jgi:hypothetical protein
MVSIVESKWTNHFHFLCKQVHDGICAHVSILQGQLTVMTASLCHYPKDSHKRTCDLPLISLWKSRDFDRFVGSRGKQEMGDLAHCRWECSSVHLFS